MTIKVVLYMSISVRSSDIRLLRAAVSMPLQLRVFGLVDDTHPARAEFLRDLAVGIVWPTIDSEIVPLPDSCCEQPIR